MFQPFALKPGLNCLAVVAALCLASAPAVGLPEQAGLRQAGAAQISTGNAIVLAQRRDDASAPVIQRPSKRRGSLFGAPFASPTAPVPHRAAPAPSAPANPSISASPPAAADLAPEDGQESAVPEAPVVPPYEREILRLAELLGSLHFLRALCDAGEGTQWRDEMSRLVAAEQANAAWRARLTQSFNGGYSAFARTYRECTASAARAAGLFIDEGKTLVATIRTRYAY